MIPLLKAVLMSACICLSEAAKLEELTSPISGYIYGAYGGKGDDVDFEESEFKCRFYNFDGLVMIKYEHIEYDVRELMDSQPSRSSHIGMHDKYSEGYWVWIDGTKTTNYYENWGTGEPNDYRGENCGAYYSPDNFWIDDDCSNKQAFICVEVPNSCQEVSTPMRSREFTIRSFKNQRGSFESAKQACEEDGLRLALLDEDEVIMKIRDHKNWTASSGYWVDAPQSCLNCDMHPELNKYICEAVHPSNMKLSSHETDYVVGDAVEIECSSFGLPVPNVTWHNPVGELTDDDRQNIYQRKEPGKSTLVIQNATLEDASRYRCFATNEINGQTNRHKTYIDIAVH